jgi:hypothetical protein
MARGWESKAVESQMDSAAAAQVARSNARMKTRDDIERESKMHGLMLSRTRVMNDIQGACNPRYRLQLEQALAYLDKQIAELNPAH